MGSGTGSFTGRENAKRAVPWGVEKFLCFGLGMVCFAFLSVSFFEVRLWVVCGIAVEDGKSWFVSDTRDTIYYGTA